MHAHPSTKSEIAALPHRFTARQFTGWRAAFSLLVPAIISLLCGNPQHALAQPSHVLRSDSGVITLDGAHVPGLSAALSPPLYPWYLCHVGYFNGTTSEVAVLYADCGEMTVTVESWTVYGLAGMRGSVTATADGFTLDLWDDANPEPCGSFAAADFDRDGRVTMGDLWAFLECWFRGDAAADQNTDGAVTAGDLFTFLERWFG